MDGWLEITLIGAIGGAAWKAWGWAREWVKRTFMVEILVDDTSAYQWIAEWMAEKVREKDCSVLAVREECADREYGPLESRATFIPGSGTHIFWSHRRRIIVDHSLAGWGDKENDGPVSPTGGGSKTWRPATFTLKTFGRDTAPLKSLVVEAELAYRKRRHGGLPLWVSRHSYWHQHSVRSGRAMDSVVLDEGVSEKLIADVRTFLASRDRYLKAGVPWRRGYLLHGPPGCGKSSLANALATECGMALYVVSLVRTDDDSLSSMLMDVKPRSVVLMEDIEEAALNGDDKNKDGVTRSGLLNALDGVVATEGRVLIMTTNHMDKLDPALIRPGRADVHLNLGVATRQQAERLHKRFFPDSLNGAAVTFGDMASGATPATIQGHLIEHWDDPEGALSAWSSE